MNHIKRIFAPSMLLLLVLLSVFLFTLGLSMQHLPDQSNRSRLINYALNYSLDLICVPLAVLIARRHVDSRPMRVLALILVASSLPWLIEGLPPQTRYHFLYHLEPGILCFIYSAFLYFTLQFPFDNPLLNRSTVNMGYRVFVGVFAVICLLESVDALPQYVKRLGLLFSGIAVVVSLLALLGARRRSVGTERQRISWVTLTMGSIYATFAVYVVTGMAGYDITFSPWANTLDSIQIVSILGLVFAMMRYRLFDIGFAINRTLVFSVTSLLLIIVFFITERAVHDVLHFESSNKNRWIDGTLAFALFFCSNRLHHRVDHWIERLLFGRWHRNAEALNHFVQKSSYFNNADDLRHALCEELVRFTGGATYAFYQAELNGSFALLASRGEAVPAVIRANEDIPVSLRLRRHIQNVSTTTSQFLGDVAIPIMQGARLDGFFILGRKPMGDNYRPDELEALELAVAQIGLMLFALRVNQLQEQNEQLLGQVAGHNKISDAVLHELQNIRALAEGGNYHNRSA